VEEESAKDEDNDEEEKAMSTIAEEKPAGQCSAHCSKGKKGGAKGKALFVTPPLCQCLSLFIADMGLPSTTRWRQGWHKKHQKERGIVPTYVLSDMCATL
jgi:hypothetical protein